jgi:hypothetical protein
MQGFSFPGGDNHNRGSFYRIGFYNRLNECKSKGVKMLDNQKK